MKKDSTPRIAILAIAACALWASSAASAGTSAWRCGNTYSDQPCPGGKPLALGDIPDARQKREADTSTREARAAGDRLERERLRQEKAQAGRHATLIDSRPPAPKADAGGAKKKKKGKKEPDYFSAHDPVATAKKKAEKAEKAGRRSAEKS
ncbi:MULTISPECIES: hypothetical protein [unclassified Variovorax]|uniref:hypothetical protein n=1 Tax=unclassified Variovorax TaxID=663243 RepID=UPI00076D4CEC|nr:MULTISPECIES: hypothetical protein [unclassified Variovorax]KWT74634.1 hypothetical protein APY03_5560 [Variovorax sp. WDL1]PNG53018.1 hypothetical protein CHC06_04362 [Variovorax sp. B2]PNG53590.1 hypothetical protein CHC07_03409 [Variovorax sp. B4]VTV11020.1 hypothetical protein WDL1CHR_01923 [Variovorax sp. WDL1]